MKSKSNGSGTLTTPDQIVVVDGHITFAGLCVYAPTAAAAIGKRPADSRPDKVSELLERGAHLEVDSELSLAVENVERQLSSFSDRFGDKVKVELIDQLRAILIEADAKQRLFLNRYADPQNAASLPGATAHAVAESNAAMVRQVRALFEGEDAPWTKALAALTKDIRDANSQVLQQLAAKKAVTTMTNLSGRPWEDVVETWLMERGRGIGDVVERTTNSSGQTNRLAGDFVITISDEAAGVAVKIAVEAKRRSRPIGIKAIAEELDLVKRNRAALAGVFVVPSAEFLPGQEPFVDIAPGWFAVAYDIASGDDLALKLALRMARAVAISMAKPPTHGEPDLAAAKRYIAEIRKALACREDIRRHHAAAMGGISNAGAVVDKIVSAVHEAADNLEQSLR